ncbi:hypothetical protein [Pseudomonas putida]|uniref:hypothetical protein n=1 Tax=Pseudomonas putida TaxID=303 RepID=UPI000D4486D0|nr:hypothetical protein [Pseudomonas putida]POF92493.1 hypothetical protein BGP83_07160 [Pseudomonas putida]
MTILFRPQGAFGWFSYTTSRDTIHSFAIQHDVVSTGRFSTAHPGKPILRTVGFRVDRAVGTFYKHLFFNLLEDTPVRVIFSLKYVLPPTVNRVHLKLWNRHDSLDTDVLRYFLRPGSARHAKESEGDQTA